MAGHWLIRLLDLDTPRRCAASYERESSADASVEAPPGSVSGQVAADDGVQDAGIDSERPGRGQGQVTGRPTDRGGAARTPMVVHRASANLKSQVQGLM